MEQHPFAPNAVIYDDSQCQVRRSFWSKDQAKTAQTKIYERTGKLRPIERCRYCSGWHLGDAK